MASLAVSLFRLGDEVNRRWPRRDTASDGWLGDSSHATRASDHNPSYPRPPGWVHARDIDATVGSRMGSGEVGDAVCAAVLRLARSGRYHPINYVIYKGTIWSKAYGFRSHRYNGTNKHTSHVHVSIVRTTRARMWTGAWGVARQPSLVPRIIARSTIRAFSGSPKASPASIARVQARLVAWEWLTPGKYRRGYVDAATKAAFKGWQRKRGYPATGVPTRAQLRRLAGARYRVVL